MQVEWNGGTVWVMLVLYVPGWVCASFIGFFEKFESPTSLGGAAD